MDVQSDTAAPLICPNCGKPMAAIELDGHYGARVQLDHCATCKLFWFDAMETVSLSRDGLGAVFDLIGRTPVADVALKEGHCPRCKAVLEASFDMTRFGRMRNYRCLASHGHAISYLQFLAEKGLLRKPTAAEFELPDSQLINAPCPSCGAAMNALNDGKCPYCGTPVVVLDLHKAMQALEVASGHWRLPGDA